MSLETRIARRRRVDVVTDKPQVDRTEHANFDRAGAQLHPAARPSHRPAGSADWARYLNAGSGWR